MKAVRLLSLAALVAVSLAPNVLANGRKPGSVLFYPSVLTDFVPNSFSRPNGILTFVSVTNTNLDTDFGQLGVGGTTNVHFEYVNATFDKFDHGNPPLAHCQIVNRTRVLTPADTLTVLTACDNGGSAANVRLGYLVITAEDVNLPASPGTPWSHDFLIGSSLQINLAVGSAYSMNAIPFDAGAGVAFHDATERAPVNHNLDFDGIEYEQVPDVLYGDAVVDVLAPSLALINLEGGINAINTVQMNMYDDDENPFSVSFPMRCWFEWPLFLIADFFLPSFQQSNGIGTSSEVDAGCIGVPANSINVPWFSVESIGVANFGGAPLAADGALLGAITAGYEGFPNDLSNGHLLWESKNPNEEPAGTAINGSFLEP